MANAKKKKNYRDSIEGMGKREINALNKEIRSHYKEHGWRKTVSVYKVAPTDLSTIVDPDGKNKAKKKKPKVTKAKTPAPKKKAKAKKKPGRPKKKATPPPTKKVKKKPGPKTKATATKKKTKKPKGAPKKNADKAATPEDEMVLDYLLRRRKGKDSWRDAETVDQVILDLTSRVRGV